MRFDLSDPQWEQIEALLLHYKDPRGRKSKQLRTMVNGMVYLLRTGCPWRDLPARYGNWKTVYSSWRRWNVLGLWQRLHEALTQNADLETCYLDSTTVVTHQQGLGAKGGKNMRPLVEVSARTDHQDPHGL